MSKLTDYKALLFDIDGTLVSKNGVITDEIVDSLNQLAEQGYKIGVCSGRGYASITHKIIPLFPKESIHILAGGSLLINSNSEIIWENNINEIAVQELRDYVKDTEMLSVFMKPDGQYTYGEMLENMSKHPWKFTMKNLSTMKNDGVGLVFITKLDDKVLQFVKENPLLSYKQMTSNSNKPYLDITAKGVNKSTALKKWSKFTNIPLSQIIGFGDSLNDIEFLETCGFAVAMGNGMDEVKEIADVTIGHVNENGLATYLSKIIKGDSL